MASLISFIKERNKTTPTWLKVLIPVLAVGGLGVVAVMAAVVAFVVTGWLGQPVPVLGFDQTFEQPISFPHTVHAGTGQLTDSSGNLRVNQNGEPQPSFSKARTWIAPAFPSRSTSVAYALTAALAPLSATLVP